MGYDDCMILGIDEVGRGCWAGPLVMGAVILGSEKIDGLTDSKVLSAKRRAELASEIHQKAAAIGLGWVHADEIDEIGLSASLSLACRRAMEEVDSRGVAYHEIIIDGTVNFLKDTPKSPYVTLLKKADLLIPAASAASIVAKEARDDFMRQATANHPEYGFDSHVGYGTAKHRQAIEQHGVCELHRLSFAPLKKYQSVKKSRSKLFAKKEQVVESVTTRSIGNISEAVAADELERLGHEVVSRNWKTKYCEIDLVSRVDGVYYFTEVKHRKESKYGDGLEAITSKKLNQMRYAAKFYAHSEKIDDKMLRLLAISTEGDPPRVVKVVEVD